jgi:hypothetical protein
MSEITMQRQLQVRPKMPAEVIAPAAASIAAE